MKRKEYITCIIDESKIGERFSLCGRDVKAEFVFVALNHWFENAKQNGRLVGCPDCLEKIDEIIKQEVRDGK